MHTEIIPASAPEAIRRALDILRAGGLVAFPTDTVYGVGCRVFDEQAVRSIYTAKDRPLEKAIPVLIGDQDDMEKVGVDIPEAARSLASYFWPGPLTILIPRRANLPQIVSATSTVGVRVPDHPAARALLQASGPMAVTSANLSGAPNPLTAEQVLEQLKGRIPLILDGGQTPGGTPSTVVDCTHPELKILREGPVSLAELQSALSRGER